MNELTKHFIKEIKQRNKDKQWIKDNFITVDEFLKPYKLKEKTNQKMKRYGT